MKVFVILGIFLAAGCARLDSVQIGSIDQSHGNLRPISVRISETGLDAAAAAEVARNLARGEAAKQFEALRNILAAMNTGPRTGNPVFVEDYAEPLLGYLLNECPGGRITGVQSIREGKTYGVVSGEIVGAKAYCIGK